MQLYIYKTNIEQSDKSKVINNIFVKYDTIKRWTLDSEDIDNVLKIETDSELPEVEIISFFKQSGIVLEELTS